MSKAIRKEFRKYLQTKCHLKETTSRTYSSALNKVSQLMKSNNIVSDSIYEINNIHDLLCAAADTMRLDSFNVVNCYNSGNCAIALQHYYDYCLDSRRLNHTWNKNIAR